MESNSIANLLGAILGGAGDVTKVAGKIAAGNAGDGVSFADLLAGVTDVPTAAVAEATPPADGEPGERAGDGTERTKDVPTAAPTPGHALPAPVDAVTAPPVEIVAAAPAMGEGPGEDAATELFESVEMEGASPAPAGSKGIVVKAEGEAIPEAPKPSAPVTPFPKPVRVEATPAPATPSAKAPVAAANPPAGAPSETAPSPDSAADPLPGSVPTTTDGPEATPVPPTRPWSAEFPAGARPATGRSTAAPSTTDGEPTAPAARDEAPAPVAGTTQAETAAPSPPNAGAPERTAGTWRTFRPDAAKPVPAVTAEPSSPKPAVTTEASLPQPAPAPDSYSPKPPAMPDSYSPEPVPASESFSTEPAPAPESPAPPAASPEPRGADAAHDPAAKKMNDVTPGDAGRAVRPEKSVAREERGDAESRPFVSDGRVRAKGDYAPKTAARVTPPVTKPALAASEKTPPAEPAPVSRGAARVNDAPPVPPRSEPAVAEMPAPVGGDPDLPVPGMPEASVADEFRIDELRVRSLRSFGLRSGKESGGEATRKASSVPAATVRHIFRSPLAGEPVLPARIEQLRSVTRVLGEAPWTETPAPEDAVAPDAAPRSAEKGESAAANEIVPAAAPESAEEPATGPAADAARAVPHHADVTRHETAPASAVTEGTAPRPSPAAPASATPTFSAGEGIESPFAPAPPAPPSAAAAALPFREEILAQVAEGMRTTLRRGKSEAEIRLDPPELGQLRIRITVTDTSLHGFIKVENPAVKAMLEADLPRLHSALAESGLDLTQFDVLLQDDHRPGSGRRQSGEAPAFAGRFAGEDAAEPAVSVMAAVSGGAGRVNYLF